MQEAITYTMSALVSALDLAFVQAKFQEILAFSAAQLKAYPESAYVGKYVVVLYQFLLHSRTKQHWEKDEQAHKLFSALLQSLLDRKEKVRR